MAKASKKKKIVKATTKPEVASATSKDLHVGKYTVKKSALLWLIPVVIILLALYYSKGLFVAATVNGQPISRLAIIRDLEKRSGKQALQSAVTKVLLLQEAKKRHISISQKDIDDQIKKIETSLKAQGQDLSQALASQGMTRDDLTTQVEQQLILEKILADKTKVTDKEIADFIEKNKSSFPENTSEADMKKTATSQLQNEKLSTEANKLLDSLMKQAKVHYFVYQ